MCRAGGRRCKGGHSRTKSNQAARQRLSRANRALTAALESGDPGKIQAAQDKLTKAQSDMDQSKHVHDNPSQTGDVTGPVPGTGRDEVDELIGEIHEEFDKFGIRMAIDQRYQDEGLTGLQERHRDLSSKANPSARDLAEIELLNEGIALAEQRRDADVDAARNAVQQRYQDKGIPGMRNRYRYLAKKTNPTSREVAEIEALREEIAKVTKPRATPPTDHSGQDAKTGNATPMPTSDPTHPRHAPKPPVSGRVSDTSIAENGWGAPFNKDINYHEDGVIGTALGYMGPDARMDIDGEPLANVVGRTATDVVTGRRTAQEGLEEYKAIRDRLPEGSRARAELDYAIGKMDAPHTPAPQVPDGTPGPLRQLVHDLHAVPAVRNDPGREMDDLVRLAHEAAAGRIRGPRLASEVQNLHNRRHESDGDAGKFEIDRAVNRAATELRKPPPPTPDPPVPPGKGDVTDSGTIAGTLPTPGGDTRTQQGDGPSVRSTADEVRATYDRLVARKGGWVSLTRLRSDMPHLSRQQLDTALAELSARKQGFSIISEANQQTLTPQDRDAGLHIGGETKHLISFEDPRDEVAERRRILAEQQRHKQRMDAKHRQRLEARQRQDNPDGHTERVDTTTQRGDVTPDMPRGDGDTGAPRVTGTPPGAPDPAQRAAQHARKAAALARQAAAHAVNQAHPQARQAMRDARKAAADAKRAARDTAGHARGRQGPGDVSGTQHPPGESNVGEVWVNGKRVK